MEAHAAPLSPYIQAQKRGIVLRENDTHLLEELLPITCNTLLH